MKSQIAVVDIVPSSVLEDRAVKYKRKNGRWVQIGEQMSKGMKAGIMTSLVAAINPDNIFVDSLEYYVDGVGYAMYNVERYRGIGRPVPIVCYKRDRVRG